MVVRGKASGNSVYEGEFLLMKLVPCKKRKFSLSLSLSHSNICKTGSTQGPHSLITSWRLISKYFCMKLSSHMTFGGDTNIQTITGDINFQ
jgi:hypothetical protein